MALIKDSAVVEDPWLAVGDDEDLPADAPVIVSLERWQRDRDRLLGRNTPLGIRLRSDQPPALVLDDLERFAVVALEFPRFGDGRAYSYARLLRERYGFEGEVRAVGDVLRDQYLFMQRCGFDAFQVADEGALEHWQQALAEISVVYQPAASGRRTVMEARRSRQPSR